jgi:hypothetical protein
MRLKTESFLEMLIRQELVLKGRLRNLQLAINLLWAKRIFVFFAISRCCDPSKEEDLIVDFCVVTQTNVAR